MADSDDGPGPICEGGEIVADWYRFPGGTSDGTDPYAAGAWEEGTPLPVSLGRYKIEVDVPWRRGDLLESCVVAWGMRLCIVRPIGGAERAGPPMTTEAAAVVAAGVVVVMGRDGLVVKV